MGDPLECQQRQREGMIWSRPRHLLVLCAGLDLLGVALIAALIDRWAAGDLWRHPQWLLP
jgi:hypothetical protein